MFTGLVEEVGTVRGLERRGDGGRLSIRARRVLEGTRVGDSIAVDGACLTVVETRSDGFVVDCMAETLTHTTLGEAAAGREVNLERSLSAGGRLGGHLVLGHVDAVAEILSVSRGSQAWVLRVSLPEAVRGCVAPKGSIALDGISLTVVEVEAESFILGVIPHSLRQTTLHTVKTGRRVNLEADVLARYVLRALQVLHEEMVSGGGNPRRDGGAASSVLASTREGGLTEELLREQGFA
jgi:riboflavin synthase